MTTIHRSVLLGILVLAAGCQKPPPENPSFRVTETQAVAALTEMEANPRPLARPLVIVSGYLDPALGAWWLSLKYHDLIDDDRILTVEYATAETMEAARAMLVRAVDEAYPTDDPQLTTQVDVVAISMGGLVARYAALPSRTSPDRRRLNIAHLFTLASPHRGATQAMMGTEHPLLKQARVGSDFMTWINEVDRDRSYQLYPYVRLGDDIIGVDNAAPVGESPLWLPNRPLEHAHIGGTLDNRFKADIARMLRGEVAYSTLPPAPLP